MNGLTNTCSA